MAEQKDNVSYWAQRWQKAETGWHLKQLNPAIQQFGEQWLGDAKDLKIMFPLCGKTLDMKLLASQGYKTFGVEGVQLALDEYCSENNVTITEDAPLSADVKTLKLGDDATVYFGDFFKWPINNGAKFDRVFDRGSLVAILPEKREEYVKIINDMLPVGGKWLIATMAYDQAEKPGAPHSVSEEDMNTLIAFLKDTTGANYKMDVLQYDVIDPETTDPSHPAANSRFLKKTGGPLSKFTDCVFLLTKVE